MGNRRSSLKEPRYHQKGNREIKLHPMSIKHWITIDMMIWLAYDNCNQKITPNGDFLPFNINIGGVDEKDITAKKFEEELKTKLRWEGRDYFDRADYDMDKESERFEHSQQFVKKLYPKWFRTNATDFIMET